MVIEKGIISMPVNHLAAIPKSEFRQWNPLGSERHSKERISQIEHHLSIGNPLDYICGLLGLKTDTVRKAIKQGRIIIPDIKFEEKDGGTTKSERNIIDDGQQMGKACSNVAERMISSKSLNRLVL